jgi:hypothetical protein
LESIEEPQEIVRPILKMKNKGGAPKANRNALKRGRYTAEQRAIRKYARTMHRYARALRISVGRELRAMRKLADEVRTQAFTAAPQ